MDKPTRNAIERATQRARRILEEDFTAQLEGIYDILQTGQVTSTGGPHLSPQQRLWREKIVAAIEHKRAAGMAPAEAVAGYIRDAAFTTFNRFVALKMLEARGLVQGCISKGEQSGGYKEFCGLAPGVPLLPNGTGYRLYIESLFDELSTEVKVLFDRRDPASILWPGRQTFEALIATLNESELAGIWGEDETIGWVYQYFNGQDERRLMREKSAAPRNSRELAVRNQFFTPRYVVQFLVDNTLGRLWHDMTRGRTRLAEQCSYLVRRSEDILCRPAKDPRTIRLLDPACGSMHFGLYAFDLFLVIYEEAWDLEERQGPSTLVREDGLRPLRECYESKDAFLRDVPRLILAHNLFGIEIDPRAAQIAALALWMRAQRAFNDRGLSRADRPPITRTNIVVAEPVAETAELVDTFAASLDPRPLGGLFRQIVGEMGLAGELGSLLRIERAISDAVTQARTQYVARQQELAKGFLPGFEPARRQSELDLSGIDNARFFAEAEERIFAALRRFCEAAAAGAAVRRRLFAEDASHSIALIEILQRRFDIVLMNPPFGAGSAKAKADFEKAYPRTKKDLYAAFVERGVELLHPRGLLGAITSRTGFFLSSFQNWREEVLLKEAPPVVVADLGYGVLDSAMVEVAAYCLEKAA